MQHVELETKFDFHQTFDATSFNISFVVMCDQQSRTHLADHFNIVAFAHVQQVLSQARATSRFLIRLISDKRFRRFDVILTSLSRKLKNI